MAYRPDKDLDFLSTLSSEELDNLVKILTLDKEGNKLLTENLTFSEKFKQYYPDHHQYWDEIAEELQLFGGNTFMNLLKGNKGVFYKEILCDVCDRLKVNYNKKSDVMLIEQHLLMKILTDSLEKMSPEEIKQLAAELGIEHQKILTPQAISTVFWAIFKAGGVKSYQLTFTLANLILKALGHPPILAKFGIIAAPNPILTKLLFGPIGLTLSAVLTVIDIAGPAYRITIPAVIEVAYLRSLSVNRKDIHANNPEDAKKIISLISNALYDPNKTNFTQVKQWIKSAENWHEEQKRELINAVYHSRTGMAGWDYVGPDSPEVISELASKPELRAVYQQAIALAPESEEAQNTLQALQLAEQKMQCWVNPIYDCNQTPSVKFQDLGLKLAVINELMFRQAKLTPKFEQARFLDEYKARCINPETNDYYKLLMNVTPFGLHTLWGELLEQMENVKYLGLSGFSSSALRAAYSYFIPEVLVYFNRLDIPQTLLNEVEVLSITTNNALYKEAAVIRNDKLFIDDDTVQDLDLLPNLKQITVAENITLPSEFIQKLHQRSIVLTMEEKVV